MLASIGEAQVLTLVIPLGGFLVFCTWGFFQRKPKR
jgi:hypothetical protein